MRQARAFSLVVILALVAVACGDDDVATDDTSPSDPSDHGSADDTSDPGTDGSAGDENIAFELPERATPGPDADPRAAGASVTDVGLALHGALDAETPAGDNLVTSPASVAIALAMLAPGTSGEAAPQLDTLLGIDDPEPFHEAMNALERALESREPSDLGDAGGDTGEVEISVANAAWLDTDLPFEQAYLDTIGTNYGAVLEWIDFSADPDAVGDEINAFVADATRDRITELIPEGTITADMVIALVNALYLRASWLEPFPEDDTADAPFTLFDGAEVDVPLMNAFGDTSASGDGWIGATKNLTGGIVVQFVLPDEGRFDDVEGRLAEVFDEYETNRTDGAPLAVPRFETRVEVGLDDAFQALGLTAVYEPGGLLGIADDERLVLAESLHETFLAVDETGIEAAAATALLGRLTSAPPLTPVPVTLDRPFLFRIVDQQTDAMLFLGRIADPT